MTPIGPGDSAPGPLFLGVMNTKRICLIGAVITDPFRKLSNGKMPSPTRTCVVSASSLLDGYQEVPESGVTIATLGERLCG